MWVPFEIKDYDCPKQKHTQNKNTTLLFCLGEEIKGLTWGLWQSFAQTLKDDDVKGDGSHPTVSLMICMATVIPQ